ncbi:MAG: UvrB/UvrC motif-containing protein [Candidatus Omnitrophota bacterium]
MVCDICHKNSATVHLTEIVSGKVAEMHICQTCAKSKATELKEQLSISDFLGGLVNIDDVEKEIETSLKCPLCGLTYNDFRKKGRLGCAQCYTTFRQQLMPLLKKIHGSTQHIGKSPVPANAKTPLETELKELRVRLERAVQLEEYEDAARLRDSIKTLEIKIKG